MTYLDTGRTRTLFCAGLVLGIGFYSYISAVLLAPVFLLITAALLFHARKPARDYAAAAIGFALPLLMLVPWLIAHPTAFGDTAHRFELYDTGSMNALQGLRSFVSYNNIEARAAVYWSFLNPSFLFFTGDLQMPFSTRMVGVFLLPMAIFMIAGIGAALRRPAPARILVLIGFFCAPLAAVLVPENSEIIRAVAMLPLASARGLGIESPGAGLTSSACASSRCRRSRASRCEARMPAGACERPTISRADAAAHRRRIGPA